MFSNEEKKAIADNYFEDGKKLKGEERHEDALKAFRKAYTIHKKISIISSAYDLMEIANCQKEIGNLKIAEKAFYDAEQAFLSVGCNNVDMATCLNGHADVLFYRGIYLDAEPLYQRALDIYENVLGAEHTDVAMVLYNIASVKYYTGRFPEAEQLYRRALSNYEKAFGPEHTDVAMMLDGIALIKCATGQYADAEALYQKALIIREKVLGRDHYDVALTLNGIGLLKFDKGRYTEAEPLYLEALSILEKALGPEHTHIATVLNNLATLNYRTGRYTDAESLYQRSLGIDERSLGTDHPNVAITLNNIAVLKRVTGQYADAERLYERVLSINEKALGPEHLQSASPINNIAAVKSNTGQYADAERLYEKALSIYEKALGPEHPQVAKALNNIANVKSNTGRYTDAEPLYRRSLYITEKALGPEHPEVATLLNNLASLKRQSGQYSDKEEVLSLYKKALQISQCSQMAELLFNVQYELSQFFSKEKQNGAAIFFGKLAINNIQDIRSNISKMGQNVLQAHQATIEEFFNYLSELLVEDGRFAEAEQVINLLKQHQYFEYIRRDAVHADEFLVKLTYTLTEAACERLYLNSADKITELINKCNEVFEKQQKTPKDQTFLSELDKKIEIAVKDFKATFDRICNKLSLIGLDSLIDGQIKETSDLMEDLRKLGPGAVALYTWATKESFHILLITPKNRKAYSQPIEEKELHKKIYTFRQSLFPQEGNLYDPIELAKELYQIILGPVANELRRLKTKTLMWSLEGPMRYIPMAALHDGEKYLAESYRNVMFTPASTGHLQDNPEGIWRGLGLGVTEHHDPFPSLPMVKEELDSIIRSQNSPDAIFEGTVHLDQSFTWKSMQKGLQKKFSLVHIASHFQCAPGNDTTSFLLLGDGQRLPIDKIRHQANLFDGVDLLTLSACNTAVGNVGQDGKEIECFGVFAQRQGAKAIVASLWPVADISTSLLMKEFYERRAEGKNKAEALQEAQIALLTGRINSNHIATSAGRSTAPVEKKENSAGEGEGDPSLYRFKRNPKAPFAHPFFWAPFILIGNWK